MNPLPNATITAVGPFCLNAPSANLTAATTGGTWSGTGITNATLGTFDPSVAGIGTHTISYNITNATTGCNNSATTQIFVNALPTPSISVTETSGTTDNDGTICVGDVATLTAGGGGTYAWSQGGTTTAITVSPTTTTTYTVTVIDVTTGCTATAMQTIIVNPLPTATIIESDASGTANDDGQICLGASVTLTASGGTSYLWNDPAATTTAAITVAPTATTTYMVTVTNANGCIAIASSTVIVNPIPNATITAAGPFCLNAPSANLTAATTGGTWSGTGITNATLGTFNPAVAGIGTHTISYNITNATTGCANSAMTQIVVNALPTPTISVTETSGTTNNDGTICVGDAATLTAAGGGSYLWSDNSTSASLSVSPTTTSTYTVTITDATTGCTATTTQTIIVNPLPPATITETDASGTANNDGQICSSGSATLTANGGTSYLWNDPAASTTAAITVSPTATTTYMVTVTDANGCFAVASSTIIVNPLPVITVPALTTVCADAAVFVLPEGTVGGVAVDGDWSGTGVVNNTDFNTALAGAGMHTLTYTFTDGNNCTNTTTAIINVNAVPIISAVNTGCATGMTLPLGTIEVLASGTGSLMYALDGGTLQASNMFTAVGNGSHTITVQDANGCDVTSTVFMINCSTSCITPPTVMTNPTGPICADVTSVAISGSIGGGATTATWSTSGDGTLGSTTALSTTYMPGTADIAAGTVTLTLTTDAAAPCMPATSNIILTINALPAAPVLISPVCVSASGSYDLSTVAGVTNWFSDAALTTELTGAALIVSPTVGTTYYGIFNNGNCNSCLLYTSPSPRDQRGSRMPSSA